MKSLYAPIGAILLVCAVLLILVLGYKHASAPLPLTNNTTASYLCRDGKTIDAVFSDTSATLTLSDTRSLVLARAVSASGIRYESGDSSFVGKGDNAFLEEKGIQTFVDCIANADTGATNTGTGISQFTDSGRTFSFSYPASVSVTGGGIGYTQDWMVNATTTGLVLAKARIDRSFQSNTNFSEATLTVGTSADPSALSTCLTYNPSGGPTTKAEAQTINGVSYTVFHSSDAGAGNRYETTSYRTVRNSQCYVVEYTIHSTAIGNYSPEQGIKEFNVGAVQEIMNSVIQSFRFTS